MTLFGEILGILLITILLSSLFYYGFDRRGPWGSIWSFLLVVFLGVLLFDIWMTPIGPMWWGIAWFDLLFFGFLFAVLLAAATPTGRRERLEAQRKDPIPSDEEKREAHASVAVGVLFWVLIFLFIAAITVGIVV